MLLIFGLCVRNRNLYNRNELECMFGKLLQPSLMYESRARGYPSEAPFRVRNKTLVKQKL